MDEDILAELDRQLTNVNLDKYWVRKVGDIELWLTTIDYVQSNRVKKALEGEFGLEEAQRVTLSAAIVGFNGNDLRPLRAAGKTIRVKGRDGKFELVDLPEVIYRKIANWDAEFIDVVFKAYADIMETHKRDLVKDIVFENAKGPEEELEELEEKASALRERLGKPPMVEAQRLDLDPPPQDEPAPSEDLVPSDEELEDLARAAGGGDPPVGPVSFGGDEDDFDPFEHVKAMRGSPRPSPGPVQAAPLAPSAPPPVPVPVPVPADPLSRAPGLDADIVSRAHLAQPSVLSEVLEESSSRSVVDPPRVDPNPASQSRNPRFRNAGMPR